MGFIALKNAIWETRTRRTLNIFSIVSFFSRSVILGAMKCKGKVFIVGVGPNELPFVSVHGIALLTRANRVILGANLPDVFSKFVRSRCQKQISKNPLFCIEENDSSFSAQAQETKGDIVWFQSVNDWGKVPTIPVSFPDDCLVIPEALPSQDEGDQILLIQNGKAFHLHSHGLHAPQPKQRSLSGQLIVVTRARAQAESFAKELTLRGARVIPVPAIRIEPHPNHADIVDVIASLNSYDWVIFSSANGVDMFFQLFFKRFHDMRDFGGARIAAVGPATAAHIQALHLQVDVIPKKHTGIGLAEAIDKFDSLENRRILLVRPEIGGADLPRILEDKGAIVDDIPFYCTVAESAEAMENAAFRTHGADWLTFCSPSAVKHFHERYNIPEILTKFPGTKIASIGPQTTLALTKLEVIPIVQADPHTVPALIDAMEKYDLQKQDEANS